MWAKKSSLRSCEEEARRFLHRYIKSIKSQNERMLQSSRERREAFRVHFRDRFARLPNLPLQKFLRYRADFPYHFQETEATGCEGLVTECEVCDALKQVDLNISLGLDGLSYEVYLRVFVSILTDMFNHWFTQGAIPTSITKGVIT